MSEREIGRIAGLVEGMLKSQDAMHATIIDINEKLDGRLKNVENHVVEMKTRHSIFTWLVGTPGIAAFIAAIAAFIKGH